jgi:catechol 2,3-dioxygenase-like lactoylglutathione lyase family enzyme
MIDINGIAHIFLTVGDMDRSREFYGQLLPFLGLTCVMDNPTAYYCIGGRTGVCLRPAPPALAQDRFDQNRVGLHHICFRARGRADIDALQIFLLDIDALIIRGPEQGPWAPGYYSILFEDPDGIRLELNHVPGQGLLDENAKPEIQGVTA